MNWEFQLFGIAHNGGEGEATLKKACLPSLDSEGLRRVFMVGISLEWMKRMGAVKNGCRALECLVSFVTASA
jgi:hypothetical protein